LVSSKSDPKCGVIFSRSAYGSDKQWVKDEEWINTHPKEAVGYKKVLIHSTPQAGVRYMWTNDFTIDKKYNAPMFGVPKVIFGDSGIYGAVIDTKGDFGMTQHGIAITSKASDLHRLQAFIQSPTFSDIIAACQWSNFMIDWRLFTFFKDGFWNVKKQNKSVPHFEKPKQLQHFRSR
jgi:hypothetical protein